MLGAAALAGPVQAQTAFDPPAELGDLYAVDGVTVTPADEPFDDVGLAMIDPFASRPEADAARSNVRKAGFAGAQIVTAQR